MVHVTGYRTPSWGASAMLTTLRSPLAGRLARRITELRYLGRRSGRPIALPVAYVRHGDRVLVRVGRAATKTWWRNFSDPAPMSVWIDQRWMTGTGRVLFPGHTDYAATWELYRTGFPQTPAEGTDPLVVMTLDEAVDAAPAASAVGRRLWRRWFALVTVGELLGFAVPAVAGVAAARTTTLLAAAALLVAGAAEGAILGWFQGHVLASVIPGLARRDWILATMLGAVVAWSLGMVPMLTNGLAGWPPLLVVPAIAAGAAVMVSAMGTAQWLVLRRHLTDAGGWIAATAVAWLAGLTVLTAVTTPLWQPGQPAALTVAIGVLGGLAMAATMAAFTGTFLVWLLRAQPHPASIDMG
ncbi:uncharacterized protein DUF385 [Nocardia bhagyanarayanae]|uniref:Uncharacterized protein DUF385 n=2 Tax=Nocardia bhagyanarayanae TaxID=1215925 RepID=A0A543FFI0_9NOCA|nr:uncharacterized protein DUF385 [Nocardia bhagyanarayanae]